MARHTHLEVLAKCFAVAAALSFTTTAVAQSKDALNQLDALYVRLIAAAATTPTIAEGFKALDELQELDLDVAKLPADARGKALAIETIGALAIGDAGRANAQLAELKTVLKDPLVLQMLTYRSAVAAGQAQQARAALDAAASNKAASIDKAEIVRAQAALDRIGTQVPPELLAKLTGSPTSPRKAIVIDFWSAKKQPAEPVASALKDLYGAFETELAFELVGINVDPAAGAQSAKQIAEKRGYAWKQHFAGEPAASLIKLVQPKDPPWQALVDARGVVRAVGTVSDPGFVYAVRAAVAEARGDFAQVSPVTVAGQRVGPAADVASGVSNKAGKKEERPKSAGDLPSNPDAEQKLNTARAFMKTGKKRDAKRLLEEIIRDYPNTREAKLAEEFLGDIR